MSPEQILSVRKCLKLTQTQFARFFSVHAMTVSKWERGVLEPSTLSLALLKELQALRPDSRELRTIKTASACGDILSPLRYLLSYGEYS